MVKRHIYLCTSKDSVVSMDVWQTKPKLCCASNKLMLKWDRCTMGPILWFWAKFHWLQWTFWVRSSSLSISHLMKTGQLVGTKVKNWPAPSLQKLKPNWTFFWGSKKFKYVIITQIGNFHSHSFVCTEEEMKCFARPKILYSYLWSHTLSCTQTHRHTCIYTYLHAYDT